MAEGKYSNFEDKWLREAMEAFDSSLMLQKKEDAEVMLELAEFQLQDALEMLAPEGLGNLETDKELEGLEDWELLLQGSPETADRAKAFANSPSGAAMSFTTQGRAETVPVRRRLRRK